MLLSALLARSVDYVGGGIFGVVMIMLGVVVVVARRQIATLNERGCEPCAPMRQPRFRHLDSSSARVCCLG